MNGALLNIIQATIACPTDGTKRIGTVGSNDDQSKLPLLAMNDAARVAGITGQLTGAIVDHHGPYPQSSHLWESIVLLLAMLRHDDWLFVLDRGMCSMKQFKVDEACPKERVS